jgi:hypothetical protein
VTFLLTLGLGVLGVGLAIAVLRATLGGDGGAPSWGRAAAAGAAAVLVAVGLVNARGAYKALRDGRAQWAPLPEAQAFEATPAGGVDPGFTQLIKDQILRDEDIFIAHNTPAAPRLWLTYRLAPNIIEDTPEEADWIVYWTQPNATNEIDFGPGKVVFNREFAPGTGIFKVDRG